MTTTTCPPKITLFFDCLANTAELDERDNRGKRHSMALVLTGLVVALCCGRDGNLSRLHRHMVHHFAHLQQATSMSRQRVISRAQLPRLLAKVNLEVFNRLLFEWFGFNLPSDHTGWFAVDGKELRGSIQATHTRGEACVSSLAHGSAQIVSQFYYTGTKESERVVVRQLVAETGLQGQKLTFDALHLTPSTVRAIHQHDGTFVVGLKSNQAVLYRYAICHSLLKRPVFEREDPGKRGHGRIEQRSYTCYGIKTAHLAARWNESGICTLIRVRRTRQPLDGSRQTVEISYFLSNCQPNSQQEANDLFDAIRHHWHIEAMHYVRDMTLQEDQLRSSSTSVSRAMSSLRTMTINLLRKTGSKNLAAQLDQFADDFNTLILFMKQQMVL